MSTTNTKTTFALFFGNRGFFPASHMSGAREELARELKKLGYDVLMMPADATRYGAVETPEEGEKYSRWLRENRGKFGGVILSLPNFGDENGAVAALKEAGVPIFIQAYPDDAQALGPDSRRDSFCGKFSIMDVFCQHGIRFTVQKPHTVSPASPRFKENIEFFDKVCRVANGMGSFVLGALGARTTPFKTVRIDELALQKHGITVETLDLSSIIARTKAVDTAAGAYKAKAEKLRGLSRWDGVPETAFQNISKLGVVIDEVIDEYKLNAMALRCWIELQELLGVSPCLIMGDLNDRGLPSACEVDAGSAVAMHALGLASGGPTACLDWNNNYGDEDDKCILFHCGPVPPSMMTEKGRIVDHSILATTLGPDRSFGPNVGRIAPVDMTFGNMLTDAGALKFYFGEGRITDDPIDPNFFGVAGVAAIRNLQDVFIHVGRGGHRHHVNITPGYHTAALQEALTRYLDFEVTLPQGATHAAV